MKIRATLNSTAGSGSVEVEASHSPNRTLSILPLVL